MVTAQPKRLICTPEEARRLHAGETVEVWRAMKSQPPTGHKFVGWLLDGIVQRAKPGKSATFAEDDTEVLLTDAVHILCPFPAGSRWWVAETWVQLLAVSPSSDQPLKITDGERLIEPPTSWIDGQGRTRWHYDGIVIAYRANSKIEFCDGDGFTGESADRNDMPRWQSPATMPRWASRTNTEVTACRVELREGTWYWVASMRGSKA